MGVRGPGLRASSRDRRDWGEMGDASQAGGLRGSRGEVERNNTPKREEGLMGRERREKGS